MRFSKNCQTAGLAILLAGLAGCSPSGPKALLEGDQLLREGKVAAAVAKLEIAAEKLPTEPKVWNHLGLAYHAAGNLLEAEKSYQRALRLDRNLFEVHFNLGQLRLATGSYREAEGALRTFLNSDPTHAAHGPAWRGLALAQFRQGAVAEAESSLSQSLRLDPKDAEAWNILGMVRIHQKRHRDAFDTFVYAAQQRSGFAEAHRNAAITAQQHLDDPATAVIHYRAYLATDPLDAPAIRAILADLDPQSRPTVSSPTAARSSQSSPVSNAIPTPLVSTAVTDRPSAPVTPSTNAPLAFATNIRSSAVTSPVATTPSNIERPTQPRSPDPVAPPAEALPTDTASSTPFRSVTEELAARLSPPLDPTPPPAQRAPSPIVTPPQRSTPVQRFETAVSSESAPELVAQPIAQPLPTPATPTPIPYSDRTPEVAIVPDDFPLLAARDPFPPPPTRAPIRIDPSAGSAPPTLPLPEFTPTPTPQPVFREYTPPTPPPSVAASAPAIAEPVAMVPSTSQAPPLDVGPGWEDVEGSDPNKRPFWQRVNPANWGNPTRWSVWDRREEKEVTSLEMGTVDWRNQSPPETTVRAYSSASPSVSGSQAPLDRTETAIPAVPVIPPPIASPRYAPRWQGTLSSGDRARAEIEFRRGLNAQERRDASAALSAYRLATQLDPTHFEAQHNLVVAALAEQDTELALLASERALSLVPESVSARFNYGVALQRARFSQDAAEQLEQVANMLPNNASVHLTLANLYRIELEDIARARTHYERVLAIQPQHLRATEIRRWLARAY